MADTDIPKFKNYAEGEPIPPVDPEDNQPQNQRRSAYPLLHESEVQASITGAVLVHDRSPHLRASGSPASSEVNSPRYQRIRSSSLRGPIGAALVEAGSGCHAFLSPHGFLAGGGSGNRSSEIESLHCFGWY
jgi:hypothetical protein